MSLPGNGPRIDRRTTLKWLAATMAAAYSGCSGEKRLGDEIPSAANTRSLGVAAAPDGIRYGTDPDVMNPVVPWARTLTDRQLQTAAALADVILPEDDRSPAASALGVHEFIDEWVSAPYPVQLADRDVILDGLEWLEQQSRARFDTGFAEATAEQQSQLVDGIAGPSASADAPRAAFFQRFRYLAVGAFYTTDEGMQDLGFIGNQPMSGAYPGPSHEAMAHLAGVLRQLDLPVPAYNAGRG